MPSPQVINLTHPTTMKFNLIRFDQISEHLRTPKQQIGSEQVLQASPRPASTELREFSQSFKATFAAIERAENYLPLQPFFNNTHFGQTLINCIHNQHSLEYLTSILWRPASAHPLTRFCHKRVCED